jgi:hypothetical protein
MPDATSVDARSGAPPGADRRWWILAILAIAQLMIVVDTSLA